MSENDTITGRVIQTYHYPSGEDGIPLPRHIRKSRGAGLPEGEYKLVYVGEEAPDP